MPKKFRAFHCTLFTIVWLSMLSILVLPGFAQKHEEKKERHNGLVQDWSNRHVVFPRFGPIRSLVAAGRDPRAIASWQAAARRDWGRGNDRDRDGHGDRSKQHHKSTLSRDWNINLGTAGTAAAMYPAKFTFDVNATPDCVNDFIVYPVDAVGSASQPNLIGLNELYSGTAPGPAGFCNGTPSGTDDGVSATTMWSYNVHAAGGRVSTSPALSLDGTKVAFVETAPGTQAHFHVLAWNTGDGVDGADAQDVLLPVTINTFVTQSPVAGSGTATDLTLGGTDSDTLSSPFVDYAFDYAYVGTDNGNLYRIQDVFCTVNPLCLGGTPPQPTLDSTFGEGGEVAVCPGLTMTGPVEDPATGNVFVGCSNGNLYGFTSAGIALANSPLVIGDSSATTGGGMVDPPLIDAVNGFVYAESGAFEGSSVLVQTKTTDLSFTNVSFLGQGDTFPLHAPAFNDAYFSSVTPSDWLLYEFAIDGEAGEVALFGISFDAGHNMLGVTNEFIFPTGAPFELSPVTEFLNGGEDRLFNSTLVKAATNFVSLNINTFPSATENLITEGNPGGTSGMVIDNVGTDPQESSVYFSVLSAHTAVKLTQAGLQ